MSKIEFTKTDLENVALLSRLNLSENEKEVFLGEIKAVLEYIDQVSEIADSNVEVSGGANYAKQFQEAVNKNTTREDFVFNPPNFYTEALLKDAPETLDNFVKVSQVLDKHKK